MLLFTPTSEDLSHVGFILLSFLPETRFQLLIQQNLFPCNLVPGCRAGPGGKAGHHSLSQLHRSEPIFLVFYYVPELLCFLL